jgi:hypothetical protein
VRQKKCCKNFRTTTMLGDPLDASSNRHRKGYGPLFGFMDCAFESCRPLWRERERERCGDKDRYVCNECCSVPSVFISSL